MTAVLMNALLGSTEQSTKWAWIRTLFATVSGHDTPYLVQRTIRQAQSVTYTTEYALEMRELADAAERESVRRMADAKALHRAGMEKMQQAEALQGQADYYSHLIR